MASAAQTSLNLSRARTRLGSRELIEKIRDGSQVAVLVEELKVHPMYSLIKCKYGNFVLASLIQQAAPRDCADEVYAKIADNVRYVATRQFGSCIIEHLLENTSIVQLESLMAKLLTHTVALAHDRFGNYVLQHIWEAQPVCREVIVQACRTRFASMALHRFAQHVIWCVVENDCDTASLEYIAEELLDDPHVFEQCCIGYVSSGVVEKLARLAGPEGDGLPIHGEVLVRQVGARFDLMLHASVPHGRDNVIRELGLHLFKLKSSEELLTANYNKTKGGRGVFCWSLSGGEIGSWDFPKEHHEDMVRWLCGKITATHGISSLQLVLVQGHLRQVLEMPMIIVCELWKCPVQTVRCVKNITCESGRLHPNSYVDSYVVPAGQDPFGKWLKCKVCESLDKSVDEVRLVDKQGACLDKDETDWRLFLWELDDNASP